ncbi:MAG TPA: hypothetical protein VE093_31680, partial [Polyangiaceae bacterium]|nr:hypothetical protein [Polyangiaceae bacterium]
MRYVTLAALVLMTGMLMGTGMGCELIAEVDRSEIPGPNDSVAGSGGAGGNDASGGMGGTGGSAGMGGMGG